MRTITTENRTSFLARLVGKMPEKDIMLVDFAYDLSKEAHRTHKRVKGGRYFEHPRAVCLILMDELGIYDRDLIIGLLLHDVGEDSPLLGSSVESYDRFVDVARFRLELVFNPRVARLVITMTKPEVDEIRFHDNDACYAYYIEQMAQDDEALLEKSLDRLHNLRSVPPNKHDWLRRQVAETKDVYLPLFRKVSGTWSVPMATMIKKIEEELALIETSLL